MKMFRAAGTNPALPPGTVEFEIDLSDPDKITSRVLSHGPGADCHTGSDEMTIGDFLNFDGALDGMTGHAIPDETSEAQPHAEAPKKEKKYVGGPFGQGAFGPGGQKSKEKDMTGGFGV